MTICTDPRMTYLNDSGYNVVRLPRKGIVPLGVIGRDGKSKSWLGTLDQIWKSEAPVPAAGKPQPVATLSGDRTGNIETGVGLDILANALNGMFGSTAPSVSASYKKARFVQFTFQDVRAVKIDPFQIGNFLAKGDLKPNPVVKRFFSGGKDIESLVVTEVLEARSLGVVGKRDAKTELSLEVENVQAILGGRVNVTAANAEKTEVVYKGKEYLAFGFKCLGIGRQGAQWTVYGSAPDAGHAFAVGNEALEGIVEREELMDIEFIDTRG